MTDAPTATAKMPAEPLITEQQIRDMAETVIGNRAQFRVPDKEAFIAGCVAAGLRAKTRESFFISLCAQFARAEGVILVPISP